MNDTLVKLGISIPFWLIEFFMAWIEIGIITTPLGQLTLLLLFVGLSLPILMFLIFLIILGVYGA